MLQPSRLPQGTGISKVFLVSPAPARPRSMRAGSVIWVPVCDPCFLQLPLRNFRSLVLASRWLNLRRQAPVSADTLSLALRPFASGHQQHSRRELRAPTVSSPPAGRGELCRSSIAWILLIG